MKSIALSLFWRLGALLGLVLLLGSAPAAGAARPVLDGLWKGQLAVPGGQLEVMFRFVRLSDGDYAGTLDVPLQKLSHMAVTAEVRGDSVRLVSADAHSSFFGRASADGRQLAGTWQQPGLRVPMVLTYTPPGAVQPAPAAYREEETAFGNVASSGKLGGLLTVPPGPGPFPAVVLLSDSGPQDRNGTVGGFAPLGLLADYLTRHGVAVLRYDDRGVGRSAGVAAGSPAELVGDAQAALNYLRTRPEVDVNRLGLIGHGEGGNVALLAAAQPLPPAFVVALAAQGLPGHALVLEQQAATLRSMGADDAQVEAATKRQQTLLEIIEQSSDNAQAQAIVANMLKQTNPAIDNATAQASAAEMTSASYRQFLGFDPATPLAAVKCPVLLLNGTGDFTINADANLAALTKGLRANKKVTAKRLAGVNHLLQPEPAKWPMVNGQPQPILSPEAQEAIWQWLAERN